MREDIRDFNVDHLADKPRAALEGDDAVVVGLAESIPSPFFAGPVTRQRSMLPSMALEISVARASLTACRCCRRFNFTS